VGAGPFVTELQNEIGDYIQQCGMEFGATTGRKRRCGWLDMVVVRDSARLNGLNSLAITKLDVLTGLDRLKICAGYDLDGARMDHRPASLKRMARCTPLYEELPGWKEDITQARTMDALPQEARGYLRRIEEISEVPLGIVSVGPGREQTIMIRNPFS
jgi:adenylosuccinate synthase